MSHGVLYVVPGSDTQQLTDAQDRPSNNAADMLFEMIARHGLRAARISFDISRRLGASESAACLIARAAIHHDLGKLLVPAELLFFPGPLSELEKRLLRMHTVAGSALAARVLSRTLQPESASSTIAAVCRHHHEP
jgi:HD-GYP domain-containing protein (c-di-GMP phosphodiesterase class II)